MPRNAIPTMLFVTTCALFASSAGCRSDDPVDAAQVDASKTDASSPFDGGLVDTGLDAADAGRALKVGTGAVCATAGSSGAQTCDPSVCGADSVCFTQARCGVFLGDADAACSPGAPTSEPGGDDRCHRTCTRDEDCGTGGTCAAYRFFGCSDFNGAPEGRRICVQYE